LRPFGVVDDAVVDRVIVHQNDVRYLKTAAVEKDLKAAVAELPAATRYIHASPLQVEFFFAKPARFVELVNDVELLAAQEKTALP